MKARPRTAGLLILLLAGTALAGCSGSGSSSTSSSAVGRAAAGPAVADVRAAPAAAAPPGAGTSVTLGSDVVRTASLDVQVAGLRAAADRARVEAEAAGGGLEAEDATAGSDVLRLRVAPARLAAALDGFAGLGRETARTVDSEDVTGQVADLDSRLATQQASVARVRALLSQAKVLADIVTLEEQLTQREGDLESLEARAKALQGSADLATVTLTITVPAPAAPRPAAATFGSGLASGLHAMLTSARFAAVGLGALLPFLPLVALAGWVVHRLRRRSATPAPGAA